MGLGLHVGVKTLISMSYSLSYPHSVSCVSTIPGEVEMGCICSVEIL